MKRGPRTAQPLLPGGGAVRGASEQGGHLAEGEGPQRARQHEPSDQRPHRAAIAGDDDLLRAGAQAIIAARAAFGEFCFGNRPGRAIFSLGARSTAKESPATGIDHELLARLHLVDAAAQHLVDFRTRLNLR